MASEARARRVAERISEELADILLKEVEDKRLNQVSVMSVEVDRELAYANIYFSTFLTDVDDRDILQALEGAKGFLRSKLASRIQLRSFPQLRFSMDTTSVRGARIDELLASIRQEGDPGSEEKSGD